MKKLTETIILIVILSLSFVLAFAGNPVELKDGTFYQNGKPVFLTGVDTTIQRLQHLAVAQKAPDFVPDDPANEFYYTFPNDKTFSKLGFNSISIEPEWQSPIDKMFPGYWKKFTKNRIFYENYQENQALMMKNIKMPVVAKVYLTPRAYNPLHQNRLVRAGLIPGEKTAWLKRRKGEKKYLSGNICFGTEYGDKINQTAGIIRLNKLHKDGADIYAVSPFCEPNNFECTTSDMLLFKQAMEKKYKTVDRLKSAWQMETASFDGIAKDSFEPFDTWPTYYDWIDFRTRRYVDIYLDYEKKMKDGYIGDKKHLYFFIQPFVYGGYFNWPSIDYYRINIASDVVGWEGNWDMFGNPAKEFYEHVQETAMKPNIFKHEALLTLACTFGKPIINSENYCARSSGQYRLPSKRSDLSTQLWMEFFLGTSASYFYTISAFSPLDETLFKTKDDALWPINCGLHHQRFSLVNPCAYPLDSLRGIEDFRKQLEPLAEVFSPLPRHRGNIAILFSQDNMIHSTFCDDGPYGKNGKERSALPGYSQNYLKWYKILRNNGVSVTPIYERQLAKGCGSKLGALPLSEYSLLIISPTAIIREDSVKILKEYLNGGGKIIMSSRSLRYNTLKNELPQFKHKNLTCVMPRGDDEKMEKALLNAIKGTGISSLISITDADGKDPQQGILSYVINREDCSLYLIINWSDSRLVKAKLSGLNGNYTVVDPVNRQYFTQKQWTSEELQENGVPLMLPTQIAKLLLIMKNPLKFKELDFTNAEIVNSEMLSKQLVLQLAEEKEYNASVITMIDEIKAVMKSKEKTRNTKKTK